MRTAATTPDSTTDPRQCPRCGNVPAHAEFVYVLSWLVHLSQEQRRLRDLMAEDREAALAVLATILSRFEGDRTARAIMAEMEDYRQAGRGRGRRVAS